MPQKKVIVIGGGVAALMAASVAAHNGARVILLEKMEKPARKLRITGKGRCNITNLRPQQEFLERVRSGADFVRPAFEMFDNQATVRFMEQIGVETIAERGERLFPASGKAWDVADAMVRWARTCGAEIRCNTPVAEITVKEGAVVGVVTQRGEALLADAVILATGGVSYPATGSTGDGHSMAYALGHEIEPLRPALVPLEADGISAISGLALRNVELTILADGEQIEQRFGEMDFTNVGLGGAIVLQVSRSAVDAIIDGRKVEARIDLKSALSPQKLRGRVSREIETLQGANFRVLLQKLIPSPLHSYLANCCDISLKQPLERLDEKQIERLISTLKGLPFRITDYRPFTEAIVTAGGVALSQVEQMTMESKLLKGLYFAGEILDLDADTGGYNIQLALSTGYCAGVSCVRQIRQQLSDNQ